MDEDDLFAQLEAQLAATEDDDDGDDAGTSGPSHRQLAVALVTAYVHDDQESFDAALTSVPVDLPNALAIVYAIADLAATALRQNEQMAEALIHVHVAASLSHSPLASTVATGLLADLLFIDRVHRAAGLMADVATVWLSDCDTLDPYDTIVALASGASEAMTLLAKQQGLEPMELLRAHAVDLADRL